MFFILTNYAGAMGTELHFSLCGISPAEVLQRLGNSGAHENSRKVSYFDDETLSAYRRGLILRKRIEDGVVETTVKRNFTEIASVPKDYFDEADFSCELDRLEARSKLRCSLKESSSGKVTFGGTQKFYAKEVWPQINWSRLKTFGPVVNRFYKWNSSGQAVVLESYELPNGKVAIELSLRVAREAQVANEERKWLSIIEKKSLGLCQDQKSKTQQLLEAFTESSLQH